MSGPVEASVTEDVLRGLKDFQVQTVERVFEHLYRRPTGSGRFLVADEVGLGKTLVARGVIARAVDHLREKGVPRIDILYICSNSDIARQNIQRLKLDGDEHMALASRLTMLPVELSRLKNKTTGVNFISFTPATSFDLAGGTGKVEERVLLYWMLRSAWDFGPSRSAVNVFQASVGTDRFRRLVDDFDQEIDPRAQQAFTDALVAHAKKARAAKETTLEAQFEELQSSFSRSDRTIDKETSRARNAFVGELRAVLAESCIVPLEPDLVILDEFQRFSHLLDDPEGDAATLARAVFEHPEVRVLLLSATPYKMYTLAGDGTDEDHYRDFVRTIRFLEGKTSEGDVETDLEHYRTAVVGVTQTDGPERLRAAKKCLESRLSKVMVRTERLASTPDRSGMLREVSTAPLELSTQDVLDYLAVQSVAREVEQPDVMEYWKSAPYALSFLDEGYKLKTELREAIDDGEKRRKIAKAMSVSPGATLPWEKVHGYENLDGGNPRMRALLREFVDAGAYRLLWIPPSLPYYALGGAFGDPGLQRLTKRLVFSSWRVVPRAIAALVSYDVERRIWSDPSASYTPEFREKQSPLLRFSRSSDGRLTGMPALALLYPSPFLAGVCNPAVLAREIAEERATGGSPCAVKDVPAAAVLDLARERIQFAVTRHLPATRDDGPVDERWYWAAPLLLDRKLREATTLAWFGQPNLATVWAGVEDSGDKPVPPADGVAPTGRQGRDHWADHVEVARKVALHGAAAVTSMEGGVALGRMPDDLVETLARLAIGGPAVTMLRALLDVVGGEAALDEGARIAVRNGAAKTAWAFRALFNQPEVMALLRGSRRDDTPYWERVLSYCVDGCLQSVLDEYVHVLRDHLGLVTGSAAARVHEIADEIVPAIELRTSRVGVDCFDLGESGRTVRRESHNLRTHFALRYGDERSEDGKVLTRADQVRKAFNSPFWPFVLATTSVGQEGLDFHTYCHAVVHWNVPSNPVDFEQREGRVHRYKGHAVRKNVAQAFGEPSLAEEERAFWVSAFDRAIAARPKGSSDIIPFWIQLDGDARVERHVPSLPLSSDRLRAERLRASLAVYRMVFGQPRQEDLVAYLLERVPEESLRTLMDDLRIDLGVLPAPTGHLDGAGILSTE